MSRFLARALFAAAVVAIVLAATAANAQQLRVTIPDPPARFLHDGANLLSPGSRRSIEEKLMAFDRQGLQIGVAIFKSLGGEPLEDVSMAIAEKWKPGDKERDDGVLLAIFWDDRKIRIEVGYGLEHRITDAMAGRIIRNDIAPEFRRKRYSAGILKAIESIGAAAAGREIRAERKVEGRTERARKEANVVGIIGIMVFIFIVVLMIRANSGGGPRSFGGSRRSGGGGFFGGFGGGGFSGGGGSFGGGGGSFGGGSFGGGGASGGW